MNDETVTEARIRRAALEDEIEASARMANPAITEDQIEALSARMRPTLTEAAEKAVPRTNTTPKGNGNMTQPSRTMTRAEFDQWLANLTKKQTATAPKAAAETVQPLPASEGPTSSKSSDDAFLVQGAEFQNRGLKALGDHLEGKTQPEPDLKGPGNAWNGRAWANLGEILAKEQGERAAREGRR